LAFLPTNFPHVLVWIVHTIHGDPAVAVDWIPQQRTGLLLWKPQFWVRALPRSRADAAHLAVAELCLLLLVAGSRIYALRSGFTILLLILLIHNPIHPPSPPSLHTLEPRWIVDADSLKVGIDVYKSPIPRSEE